MCDIYEKRYITNHEGLCSFCGGIWGINHVWLENSFRIKGKSSFYTTGRNLALLCKHELDDIYLFTLNLTLVVDTLENFDTNLNHEQIV